MALLPTEITLKTFKDVITRYDGVIPDSLSELENYRMILLPDILKERQIEVGRCWIAKEELLKLVEWKL